MLQYHRHLLRLQANKEAQALRRGKLRGGNTGLHAKRKRGALRRNEKGQYIKNEV